MRERFSAFLCPSKLRYYTLLIVILNPILLFSLSLIVLYGPARYQFEHSVLREDVQERRVCIAYREFTPMYINGEDILKGDPVREKSQLFWEIN